ncbi:MAG: T9SS type A sorting domain-containing protein, partial [Bacteroidota bacterium]
GYGSNAMEQMFYGDFRPIADTAGFAIVHPLGTRDFLQTTHWNVGWGGSNVDDLSFVNALLDSMITHYKITPNRIYSTGMSNGGFMSHLLACELSPRIAAIASVTGSMADSKLASCDPQRPVPVMQIHGTADMVVPYAGQPPLMAPIDSVVAFWVGHNECDPNPTITDLPDISPNDGSTAQLIEYQEGDGSLKVQLYKIANGGHTWPNNQFVPAGTNYDFDASKVIWEFFAQYSLSGAISTTSLEPESQGLISLFPNPCGERLSVLRSSAEPEAYQISNLQGQRLKSGILAEQSYIEVQDLTPGVYFLHTSNQHLRFVKQ